MKYTKQEIEDIFNNMIEMMREYDSSIDELTKSYREIGKEKRDTRQLLAIMSKNLDDREMFKEIIDNSMKLDEHLMAIAKKEEIFFEEINGNKKRWF